MNHLIKNKQPLLNKFGQLSEPGYATSEIFEYNPEMIATSKWRIKEWDYYAVLSDTYGFSVTVADLGYLGLLTICFFDFTNQQHVCKSKKIWFPFGKMNLPHSSQSGDIHVNRKGFLIKILHGEKDRRIIIETNRFFKRNNLRIDVRLKKMNDDHMMIATPWKNHTKAFYYNQKINAIPVTGDMYMGDVHYEFNPKNDFAVLDWGRGVWTYKNTWYWGSLSTVVDGKRLGLNMGYGFGDLTKATENMIVYDGKAHKLDLIRFEFNPANYMEPWEFVSNDERLYLEMKPLVDRQDDTNLIIIKNKGHQVFGQFNGYLVLDDGKKLIIKDALGFGKAITNHY
jgi:hypothetical protein